MKQKYQKKDIYFQKLMNYNQCNTLLMNYNQYNNIIMEYQKIKIFSDNTPNQLAKFKIKNWVEINDLSREV